jgi:hypothetical protein
MEQLTVGNKTVFDLTKEEVVDFIYSGGYCGSPEYYEKPVIDHFKVNAFGSGNTLFFDIAQNQKREFGELKFNYRMHLTLNGDSPVLYSQKHGSYPFKLKEINYFLRREFKLDVEGVPHPNQIANNQK